MWRYLRLHLKHSLTALTIIIFRGLPRKRLTDTDLFSTGNLNMRTYDWIYNPYQINHSDQSILLTV